MGAVKEPVQALYETDFQAWTEQQADALKRRDWRALDIGNLIEEVEAMGRQERSELVNRLAVLLAHLAKWQMQTAMRELHGRSWQLTVIEQRAQIDRLMRQSPSLKPYTTEAIAEAWRVARPRAARESGLALESFPEQCPYAWDEATRDGWMPD